jgi:hypothetical protein
MGMTRNMGKGIPAKVDRYDCGECHEEFEMHCGDEPIYCPFCGKQLDLES